ncbi:unnamed protein product [Caenorhabditis brenneri]
MSKQDVKEQQLLLAETKFGLDLLRNQLKINDDSFVFSLLSVSLALALVHSGAENQSKAEIEKVLLGGASNEDFVIHFSNLSKSLKTAENGTEVHVANRVYVNDKVQIESHYLSCVKENYDAAAELLDFVSTDSADKINSFIRESTQRKLDNLVSSESISDAVALLVNAVYFKGEWDDSFSPDSTADREFTTKAGEIKKIPFLTEIMCDRGYASDDIYQVLVLNYRDDKYKFAIFLPKEGNELEDALRELDAHRFQKLLQAAKRTYMNTQFSKFTIRKEMTLKESLQSLGITEIFTDQADLSGIAEGIKISDGSHSALIEVNEEGTTAAAATVIKAVPMCLRVEDPVDFNANHPFLFALVKDNHPLFLGVFYG